MSVLFLRRLLTSLSRGRFGELWWSFLGIDLLENPDDLSDCEPETRTNVSAVPVVTDVVVSLSSVVTECYEDVSLDSDWEFVQPQFFSFSKKRSIVWEENRGEMSYEGTPAKAPPKTRRRLVPPTPQQSSHSSTDVKALETYMISLCAEASLSLFFAVGRWTMLVRRVSLDRDVCNSTRFHSQFPGRAVRCTVTQWLYVGQLKEKTGDTGDAALKSSATLETPP